jgi:hypothetical protein
MPFSRFNNVLGFSRLLGSVVGKIFVLAL